MKYPGFLFTIAVLLGASRNVSASGHGPVFGAATPTLGRGGWSVDQAFTMRFGEQAARERMLKTIVTFGITEVLQVSGSVPLSVSSSSLPGARMMSAMSGDREFEALVGYRFQRRPVGVGGRQESTLYLGGTAPTESDRSGVGAGASVVVSAATGYAGRTHYAWVSGNLQKYAARNGGRLGASETVTAVYGYRPAFFRADTGRPDLRFFAEATFENRHPDRLNDVVARPSVRTVFVGPTALLVYKAIAVSAGLHLPVYQRAGGVKERARVAVNFSYFFWLK